MPFESWSLILKVIRIVNQKVHSIKRIRVQNQRKKFDGELKSIFESSKQQSYVQHVCLSFALPTGEEKKLALTPSLPHFTPFSGKWAEDNWRPENISTTWINTEKAGNGMGWICFYKSCFYSRILSNIVCWAKKGCSLIFSAHRF